MRPKIKALAKFRKKRDESYEGEKWGTDYKRKRIRRKLQAKKIVSKYL